MVRVKKRSDTWFRFFFSIIVPTMLAIVLSAAALYLVIIPAFTRSFVDGKKEMMQELTNVAWTVLDQYHREEKAGRLSRDEAQLQALATLESLRYGKQGKDYFWITDEIPTMVMHPYSKELIGADLNLFEDAEGKRIFQEIKKTVTGQDSGFVDYSWNKKYGEERTVPKLSFVKRFTPWQWVVGTGIYLDDVQHKTAVITRHLSMLSLAAISLITLLMLYVGRGSYVIELQRKKTEAALQHSRWKYKRLAQSATDPVLMFFGGICIYANKPASSLLQYSEDELKNLEFRSLFEWEKEVMQAEMNCSPGELFEEGSHEVTLRGKNKTAIPTRMSISRIDLGEGQAVVMNLRDMRDTGRGKKELDVSLERYRVLTSRLNIGVFRSGAEKSLPLVEANPAALSLFAIKGDGKGSKIQNILEEKTTDLDLYTQVCDKGYLKDKSFTIRGDEGARGISLSLVLTRDEDGEPLYCDGIIEDISERIKKDRQREKLIVELQTSLLFLNQPIRHIPGDVLVCNAEIAVSEAARLMAASQADSILVRNKSGQIDGILTDRALRDKVLAQSISPDIAVSEIMSSPLIFIEDSALIFEASMLMEENGVRHLIVRDANGEIRNVLSNEDLLNVHRYSSTFLISEIGEAQSVTEVVACRERLPRIVKALVDSGAHAKNITRIITTVSDAVLDRLVHFAIEELGEPPARFAFISLGSEGREEQTLATDQDNAIIFADVAEDEYERVSSYFRVFAERICTWLDQAGYAFCQGEIMAMNPKWCQSLSVWKEYFSCWITEARPKDLMEVSIFFDFRCMLGDSEFTRELHRHIKKSAANRDAFFYQLAQNALLFRLPLDFFGNIAVESKGEHPNTFNIKHVIALIVGYARLYAIHFSLESTNTLQRLDLLRKQDFIKESGYIEISEAYNYLMQIRFRHQVDLLNKGEKPDNHIRLEELTYMEKSVLKKIFSHIGSLQKRLDAIGKVEIFF